MQLGHGWEARMHSMVKKMVAKHELAHMPAHQVGTL
jgi:hypothetical protein